MPRFYFDVREGARFVPDDEGMEFPDLDAAEREAAVSAASIGRDLLPKGVPAKSQSRFATNTGNAF